MKVNIAICDDEKNYINEIIDYLDKCPWKRNNQFNYHIFTSGEELLKSNQLFEFIILDIEMDRISGVEVKEIFYQRKNQSRIIFLTNYNEYMSDSFGKNVYGYVNKDEVDMLEVPLNKIFKEMLEHRTVQVGEDIVDLFNVYYVSADGPYINIHFKNDYQIYRKTLKEFITTISNSNFVRVHKSFYVNMHYIDAIDTYAVTLDNGAKIKIARGKYKAVTREYRRYIAETVDYD